MGTWRNEDVSDKPSYWIGKAAGALDCAVQLTGDHNSDEINSIEKRLDELAVEYITKGK